MRICQLVLLVPAALACENPLYVSDCPGQVWLTVGSGLQPEFAWSPACHVFTLTVSGPGDVNHWIITSGHPVRGQRVPHRIEPPVRYGQAPADVLEDLGPDHGHTLAAAPRGSCTPGPLTGSARFS